MCCKTQQNVGTDLKTKSDWIIFNPSLPFDAIWWNRSGSTLAQINSLWPEGTEPLFQQRDLLFSVGFSVIHLKAIALKDAHYLLLWSTHDIHRAVWLTHWGRVTHICISNLTIIGSDNGLSPGRRQAIIWNNAGILLIGPLGTNFDEILIKFNTFSFKNIHLKISSGKWLPFCLGLNVLTMMAADVLSANPHTAISSKYTIENAAFDRCLKISKQKV